MGAVAIYNGMATIATTGTAVELGSQGSVDWLNIIAPLGNIYPLKVGASTVTDSDTATTDGYLLNPGKELKLGGSRPSATFINGKKGDKVYWVGGRV